MLLCNSLLIPFVFPGMIIFMESFIFECVPFLEFECDPFLEIRGNS
uniref:Uncharacterized protein n=1 Tax=Arundo donax TaxID=35708 RepID=A0A0A9G9Z8_ARUDO